MQIVLDAMGSDTHPDPEIEAAVSAAKRWNDPVILTGPESVLEPRLSELGVTSDEVELVHAPEVLEMTDKPAKAARGKSQNSMAVGMDLVKAGQADAFVTAGNTGGAMAVALFRLGRLRGVKRPALAPFFPVYGGQALVLDIGANTDCKPEYLLQFGIMGSAYVERVYNLPSPRVALLSNGEEPGKGSILIKETYPLFQTSRLNFIGNVEPKEVYAGEADVVVTDGFTGNIFLKASEAVAKRLTDIIRDELRSEVVSSVAGILARPAFRRVKKILDPAEYGAAPLLGINGLVYIGHGRSDARALINAIRVARLAVDADALSPIRDAIQTRLHVAQEEKV